ncbi:MAG TPA: ATP-binding protein [Vicinamibacterales bacterium]|nr:ATP-binding protein [Vicinamibacterales bacterium]
MNTRLVMTGRIVASLAAVAAVTAGYAAFVPVNPTTIALTYVVVILLIATTWGIAESTIASFAAMLCLNFFFLPPVGTLTIADPQNWVALIAFLATAIVASQLSGRARARNIEALNRQADLERLYALSRALLLSEGGASLPAAIARHIADAFGLQGVGIYDQRRDSVSWAGPLDVSGSEDKLREVARRGVAIAEPSGFKVIAIQLGGQSIGSVAVMHADLSDTVLHSIANLAAIGLERARGEEATARAEAARHSSELRATVLDALAHEFKTPLTSMKAAASSLLTSTTVAARDRELAAILDEDLDRFQGLVTDAIQMLRIDAGDFAVHRERHNLRSIIDATLRRFEHRLDGHQLVEHVGETLTVDADRGLLELALRQLLDNALKYSPPTSTIELQAESNGVVEISVRNSGSTIPESERPRVVERFYRGSRARNIPGTGMGLAIVQQIARSHGGSLSLTSTPDAGTAFTLALPRGESHE